MSHRAAPSVGGHQLRRPALISVAVIVILAGVTVGAVAAAAASSDARADGPRPGPHTRPSNPTPAPHPTTPAPRPAHPTPAPAPVTPGAGTLPTSIARTLSVGSTGRGVRALQTRLDWAGSTIPVTGTYGPQTSAAVRLFQSKHQLVQSGSTTPRTYALLARVTARGAGLDPRCGGSQSVLCIDKSQKVLRYLVNGRIVMTLDVRFGSESHPTREGVFSVYSKDRNHVSTQYHTPMPDAMFYSGGQAIHYSKFFAAAGYDGHSHGCVNVRDRDRVEHLFELVSVGTKVVIYRTAPGID